MGPLPRNRSNDIENKTVTAKSGVNLKYRWKYNKGIFILPFLKIVIAINDYFQFHMNISCILHLNIIGILRFLEMFEHWNCYKESTQHKESINTNQSWSNINAVELFDKLWMKQSRLKLTSNKKGFIADFRQCDFISRWQNQHRWSISMAKYNPLRWNNSDAMYTVHHPIGRLGFLASQQFHSVRVERECKQSGRFYTWNWITIEFISIRKDSTLCVRVTYDLKWYSKYHSPYWIMPKQIRLRICHLNTRIKEKKLVKSKSTSKISIISLNWPNIYNDCRTYSVTSSMIVRFLNDAPSWNWQVSPSSFIVTLLVFVWM